MNNENALNSGCTEQKPVRIGLLYIACVLVLFADGFSMFKMVPIIPSIMDSFGVDMGPIGILNGSNNWISLALAIPMAFFVRAVKPRISIALGGVAVVLGHLIPLLSQSSFAILLAGRMVEGIGINCILMTAMSFTTALFMGRKRMSAALGLALAAMNLAESVHLNVASLIVPKYGWQGVYIYIAVIQAICIGVFVIVCGKDVRISGSTQQEKPSRERTIRVYKNKNLWFITIAKFMFTTAIVCFGLNIPTYFVELGMTSVQANGLYSISSLLGIAAMVGSGVIADKFKSCRKVAIVAFAGGAVMFVLLAKLPVSMMIIFVLIYGTIPRAISPMTDSSVGNIVEAKSDVPIARSLLDTFDKVGLAIIPIVMGYVIELSGWTVLIIGLAVCMVIGTIMWILAKKIA